MTDAEYVSLQCQLVLLTNLIGPMNLDEFISRIELAHAIGPVVEPSQYATTRHYLTHIERLARAARIFQKSVAQAPAKIRQEHGPPTYGQG